MNCMKCNNILSSDEIGLHRKLFDKEAKECMCITCMSEYFEVPKEALYKKIAQYKKLGCTLFEN